MQVVIIKTYYSKEVLIKKKTKKKNCKREFKRPCNCVSQLKNISGETHMIKMKPWHEQEMISNNDLFLFKYNPYLPNEYFPNNLFSFASI